MHQCKSHMEMYFIIQIVSKIYDTYNVVIFPLVMWISP